MIFNIKYQISKYEQERIQKDKVKYCKTTFIHGVPICILFKVFTSGFNYVFEGSMRII